MTQPWLSVLIPTYNGEAYLASALDSILEQGDINIECIVIDDGSNDRTLSILNSYQDKLPLKIIQRERIGNWVANTNYALSLASAEYVCFLHQDDIWLTDRLAKIKTLIAQYPQINLFLHSAQFIDIKGNLLGSWQCPLPPYPFIIDANLIVQRLLIQNFISIPAPIFKREVALSIGGLDEKLWYTADWDFWLKIAASGQTIYYPKPLSAFRIHSDSQTIVRSSYLQEFQEQLEIVLDRHWELWAAPNRFKKAIWKISKFSIEVNTTLAGLIHGKKSNLLKLCTSFLSLSFSGWHQYLRNSRIWERVSARLKTRLMTNSQQKAKK